MLVHQFLWLGTLGTLISETLADPNDFVNPQYVLVAVDDPETESARTTIVRNGKNSMKQGPWSVTNSKVRAATNDSHDYLSWAPYHWPDCNWCRQTKGTNSGSPTQSGKGYQAQTNEGTSPNEPYGAESANDRPIVPPYNNMSMSPLSRLKRESDLIDLFRVAPDSSLALGLFDMMGGIFGPFVGVGEKELRASDITSLDADPSLPREHKEVGPGVTQTGTVTTAEDPIPTTVALGLAEDRATVSRDNALQERPVGDTLAIRDLAPLPSSTQLLANPTSPAIPMLTQTSVPPIPPSRPNSSTKSPSNPAEFPFRAHRSTKTAACKTSPTRSMQPSETWSTCPYKSRDGRVNPDVREINTGAYFGQMSQSVLWNSIAWVAAGSSTQGKYAVTAIDVFFLQEKTKMNPHVEYGQVVRGPPGTQPGSFMGVLDMRGLAKVVNAVLVLRASKHPDWNEARDTKMRAWAQEYLSWVESSAAGKKAKNAANNHGSFYPNQVAALKILSGDFAGARIVLQSYFDNQFQDQIVSSGEQPLEAVRTRPFHYRCFNLEAVITNAKLGDYIGMNLWDVKSKYGATIQTAVNYIMTLDPGHERREEALPHVAAIAAVYGDPRGDYAAYLSADDQNYLKRPFWFYNQPGAISTRPHKKRGLQNEVPPVTISPQSSRPAIGLEDLHDNVQAAMVDQDHPPSMFANGRLVELEDGFFVGWEDVREFYKKTEKRIFGRLGRGIQQNPTPPMFQDGKGVEPGDRPTAN